MVAAAYGLRDSGSQQDLYDRLRGQVDERLDKFKTVGIPENLASSSRIEYPFNQDGNGWVGYNVFNHRKRSDNTVEYFKAFTFDQKDNLVPSGTDNPVYYNKHGTTKLRSTSDMCRVVITSTQSPPPNDTIIIMGSVFGVVVIALIIVLIVYCKRKQLKRCCEYF